MTNISDLTNREPITALPVAAERSRLRKAFGITQAQLAAALGVARQTVISWEKGSEPGGKTRDDYAAVLFAWRETERSRREIE